MSVVVGAGLDFRAKATISTQFSLPSACKSPEWHKMQKLFKNLNFPVLFLIAVQTLHLPVKIMLANLCSPFFRIPCWLQNKQLFSHPHTKTRCYYILSLYNYLLLVSKIRIKTIQGKQHCFHYHHQYQHNLHAHKFSPAFLVRSRSLKIIKIIQSTHDTQFFAASALE